MASWGEGGKAGNRASCVTSLIKSDRPTALLDDSCPPRFLFPSWSSSVFRFDRQCTSCLGLDPATLLFWTLFLQSLYNGEQLHQRCNGNPSGVRYSFSKRRNHRDAFRFINTICRIEANLEMKKQTNKQTIVPSRTGSERRRRRGRRKRKKRRGIRRRLLGISNVYLRLERGSRVRRGCMGMREEENSQARV